jgi:hypothetical protein
VTSSNDITGDKLISKPTTKEYEEGWDRIFSSKNELCKICGKDLSKVTECDLTLCLKMFDKN